MEVINKKGNAMITVSENAKEYINQLMTQQSEAPGSFVRVGVKGGGCSGLEYQLKFDNEIKQGDEVYEDKGIKIVVDFKSLLYLYGTELDYSGGLNGKGLTFNNPNATKTCSCGESFSV
jgi:iron-sulfur cluster assembly protein